MNSLAHRQVNIFRGEYTLFFFLNGNGTHSCTFAILKIALLILFEIFLYYSKNEKKLKIGIFIRINATYDQIYHGYLVNMYKLFFAQREAIHYSKSPNANFLDLDFIKLYVKVINDIENKFCSISTKQDNFSRFDSFLSKWPISCTILATLSQSRGPGGFKFSVFDDFIRKCIFFAS